MSLGVGNGLGDTKEVLESLAIILEDETTFSAVLARVFTELDLDHNDELDVQEFKAYLLRCSTSLGLNYQPNDEQVEHVFHHLDLNRDNCISKEEMAVFLRHLLKEQLKHYLEKLRNANKAHARSNPGLGRQEPHSGDGRLSPSKQVPGNGRISPFRPIRKGSKSPDRIQPPTK